MDRTAGQVQVRLSLLRSISLIIQPLDKEYRIRDNDLSSLLPFLYLPERSHVWKRIVFGCISFQFPKQIAPSMFDSLCDIDDRQSSVC
jgi:hypothetical protein